MHYFFRWSLPPYPVNKSRLTPLNALRSRPKNHQYPIPAYDTALLYTAIILPPRKDKNFLNIYFLQTCNNEIILTTPSKLYVNAAVAGNAAR